MAAVPAWRSIRRQVVDDAMFANGQAHLEATEVPQWIEEADEHDIAGEISEALSGLEGKKRERLCALLADLCDKGDDIAHRHVDELLDLLRSTLTDHCIRQAQMLVDAELQ